MIDPVAASSASSRSSDVGHLVVAGQATGRPPHPMAGQLSNAVNITAPHKPQETAPSLLDPTGWEASLFLELRPTHRLDLTWRDFSSSALTDAEASQLDIAEVEFLNFRNNRLTGFVQGPATAGAIGINLSNNAVTTLAFPNSGLPRLCALNISGNPLDALPERCAEGMPHLVRLHAWQCGLVTLPEDFDRLTRLRAVNLSGNRLTSLPPLPPNLRELHLSGNAFHDIPSSLTGLHPGCHVYMNDNPLCSEAIAGWHARPGPKPILHVSTT
ncbi:leucine-rich repeat domain-containing protein [Pandoraea sp. NPDC090278]|uniref:leucine-rich repeat domain-containing protein n=1 Tax=Pandoraea sp. NPDC090278 TaxID=3364391 RepID=UPI00383B7D48